MKSGLRNTRPWNAPQRRQAGIRALCWIAMFLLCFARGIDAYASDAIETAGDILQYIIPATAGGLTLGYGDYRGTLQFGASFAVTEGVTYGLKYTVDETRPNGGTQSFPSGHTSVSFCGAEFIRKRYGWELGIPAYAAASFVAYSRVESNEHWPHDVIAGAGIGILSSFIFTKPYKGWKVKTEAGPGLHGLFLSKNW
jgi:membrane-associated phospholipid phosphatase